MIEYKKHVIRTEDDMIKDIFGKAKIESEKKLKLEKDKSTTEPVVDPTYLSLSLRDDVDLIEIHNVLKRKKDVKHVVTVMPFKESLVSTGEVLTVRGIEYISN